MNDGWAWLFVLSIIILDLVVILIITNKFWYNFFWATPNRTTTFFARWYALIPSLIFISTYLVIFVDKKYEVSSAIDLIPLVLLQFPKAIYNSHVVNLNSIKDKNKVIHIEDSEAQKIIEKERAFISVMSIVVVLVAYICILYAQARENDVNLTLLFLFLIIVIALTFTALRIFIYSKFIKNENKTT